MYNDTIKVANRIISDDDLRCIFQKMDDELRKNTQLANQEVQRNQGVESFNQNWTMKNFSGSIKCTFNFYDDTNITVDNYNTFITIFNSRIHEIKDMWVRNHYNYWIKNGSEMKSVSHSIMMNIYEHKMSIDVNLCSEDNKMQEIYELIKSKILAAPEKYDRLIKKKSLITNKIIFGLGLIPSLIVCTTLAFIPVIGNAYSVTYILYPFIVLILGFLIGNFVVGGKVTRLYIPLSPKQKYAGYDVNKGTSVYKDDIDDYVNKSEIIIGKNVDNISNRNKIKDLEEKYGKFLPKELLALLILSIIVVIIGRIL